jgi:uncharacterized protein
MKPYLNCGIFGQGLELNDILNALIEIDDLALPYKFDLVIYDRIQEEAFLEHIERVGIALFDKAQSVV